MGQERIRVGIVGVGVGALLHIPGFQACADTEVVAVCSARRDRAETVAKKFAIPYVFADYREMVELEGLEAVAITTPPRMHYSITMAALEANKHVLCEKPMAMNSEEARRMYEEAENRKLTHMMNHEFRFFPVRTRMKELIDEGYLGELLSVHSSTFYGPKNGGEYDHMTVARSWNWWSDKTQGGGLLGALGSHTIDALRHWFGELAGVYGQVETIARARKVADSEEVKTVTSDDAFAFLCRFQSGALGTVDASSAARFASGAPGMPSFQAFGSEGSLFLRSDGVLMGGRKGDREAVELPIPERLKPHSPDGYFLLPPFGCLVKEFVRGIKEGRQVEPNFYDGMKHREIMDAIHLSESEARWVNLPLA